ncbi:MAG: ArsR family transcriptional regulator [Cellulomonas sp. 73-145]|uniref:helix-turn-helix domain-containing protein n=1 Tax=Cellulomonas sp. 73-145 TaxID=1895739 RepID=UPI00092C7090|nr:helix-turn-helix domain-containing protein [Cellulomonas sp. 73-145]MBN9328304.1 helix-turn-helix domain-containing protein [Cellulomonas sp.]OJV59625.1 MAG: ArsR family transcriptional regulator [Cellulomonas sp. 73-145]
MNATEVLLHPVRLRIVAALSGVSELTTRQLCERISAVSRVTVYRQLALLLDAGYIEVAGEARVRGAVERRYRLLPERPRIGADLAADMTVEDHRRGFAAAMAVLIAEFNAYLDGADADPVADQVGYRQAVLWLSPTELAELLGEMVDVLRGSMANEPAPDRRPYVLSPVLFPHERQTRPPADA